MPGLKLCCYAHEDEPLLKKLEAHLTPLQRQGLIATWNDRDISAGYEWEQVIKEQLNSAQIILLLVSADFMASDFVNNVELKRAIERHNRGEARVIPIILRHVYWQGVLGKLQSLPKDAKPVTSWPDPDEAFFNVAEGIRKVVEQLSSPHGFASPAIQGERQQEVAKPAVLTSAIQQGGNVSSFLAPLVVEKLALLRTLTGHTKCVASVAISPDGQTLVSGSWDTMIKVWNLSTGMEVRTITGHTQGVLCVAISPDGQTLISGSWDSTIKVWNLATGQGVRTIIPPKKSSIKDLVISADGHTLIGISDYAIHEWNLPTGQGVRSLISYFQALFTHSTLYSVAISPDGQTLVSGEGDGSIKVWNLSTGKVMLTLVGHSFMKYGGDVSGVAISPDGQTLVSGGADTKIKVWNLSIGKEVKTLYGHTHSVESVAISPDGQTMVSGSVDDTIKVWNLSTGKEVKTLYGHKNSVKSVAISPDGQTLASGSSDGTIKLWGEK